MSLITRGASLALVAAAAAVACAASEKMPVNIPMNRVEDFVSSRFEAGKPASLPFSFVYGGRSSGDLLPGWKITRRTAFAGPDMAERVLTCFDPGSGLQLAGVSGFECNGNPDTRGGTEVSAFPVWAAVLPN